MSPNLKTSEGGCRLGRTLMSERELRRVGILARVKSGELKVAWSRAKYRLQSRGVELTATLVVAEQPLDRAVIYQYAVGTAYLIIGLFVYFRRGSAQKARH